MLELNWEGKSAAKKIVANIPFKILTLDEQISCGDKNSGNIIAQGDNLEVLKSLLPLYRGRVKCVYIDPPYNTGAAFENYSDNFPHSDWLSMMYPRLELLRDFLSDDGAIFISIDDNEQAYLKVVCDEIFGRNNFVATVIWERAYAPVNLKKHFSPSHDYIICYAKNFPNLICNGLTRSAEANSRYKNPDNDPRGTWTSSDLSVGPVIEDKIYEITTPSGRKIMPPSGYCWRLDKETFQKYVDDNRIWFGDNGNNVPRIKRFLSEVKQTVTPMTIWKYTEVGHSQDATKALKEIFDGQAVFTYPKPVDLIKRCFELYTDKNAIVLDSFAGSGTTAHAVINLNAEDGGNRKFILIEEKDYCKTITAERVRRVGGEFNFYRLGEKLIDAGKINSSLSFEDLAKFIWYGATGMPYLGRSDSALLGEYDGAAIYLLYGNNNDTLTKTIFSKLPHHDGEKIIYGSACRLSKYFLNEHKIIFRKLPKSLNMN
ncbi:MAG: site-specific DNA-methyltransferase [Selenomonadaceae bacterium]|nr:site-specific DNA-methyltransferase [Selenomonadaceae bacterium]